MDGEGTENGRKRKNGNGQEKEKAGEDGKGGWSWKSDGIRNGDGNWPGGEGT